MIKNRQNYVYVHPNQSKKTEPQKCAQPQEGAGMDMTVKYEGSLSIHSCLC